MPQPTQAERLQYLERKMADHEFQFSQFRDEVRLEFSALRAEMRQLATRNEMQQLDRRNQRRNAASDAGAARGRHLEVRRARRALERPAEAEHHDDGFARNADSLWYSRGNGSHGECQRTRVRPGTRRRLGIRSRLSLRRRRLRNDADVQREALPVRTSHAAASQFIGHARAAGAACRTRNCSDAARRRCGRRGWDRVPPARPISGCS